MTLDELEKRLKRLREAGEREVGEALEPLPHKRKRQKGTYYANR